MADGTLELTVNRNVLDDHLKRQTGNRLATHHLLLTVGATRSATTTAVRRLSSALSNPVAVFARTGAVGVSDASPLSASLPDEIAIVSTQLLPAGFNLSAVFPEATGETDA